MFGTRLPSPALSARDAMRTGIIVTVVAASALLAACGGEKKATQVAAKVNKEEITVHQINFLLARQGSIKPDQRDAASRAILENLIGKELAYQKAVDQKLDRDPTVMEAIELAKRELVVQAFYDRVAAAARQPDDLEIKQYYEKHPALFSARRIYSFQELAVEAKPEQIEAIKNKITTAKTFQELESMLQAEGLRVSKSQVVRPAEQLPLAQLETFAQMKDGQVTISTAPPGLRVLILAASEERPVTFENAKPAIELFLTNERKRKLMEDESKGLRTAAKIEYKGQFAASAPAPDAPVPLPVAAPEASAPLAGSVLPDAASSAP